MPLASTIAATAAAWITVPIAASSSPKIASILSPRSILYTADNDINTAIDKLLAIEKLVQSPYLLAMVGRYEELRAEHDQMLKKREKLLAYIPWLRDVKRHGIDCRQYLSDINRTSERLRLLGVLETRPSSTDTIIRIPTPPYEREMLKQRAERRAERHAEHSAERPAAAAGQPQAGSTHNYVPARLPTEIVSNTYNGLSQFPGISDLLARYRRNRPDHGPSAVEEEDEATTTVEPNKAQIAATIDTYEQYVDELFSMIQAHDALQASGSSTNQAPSNQA